MAQNPIEKTLNQIGNVIEDLFGGSKEPTVTNSYKTTGQTCLEESGMRLRALHLKQNTWRRNDIEYSRPLVLAEYDIQTEFKISTAAERFDEAESKKKAKEEARLLRKTEKSKTVKAKNKRKNSQPDTLPGIPTDAQPGGAKKDPVIYETNDGLHNWENDLLNP